MPPKSKKKAWKGERKNGPAPARHIPWPEIFKHHISLIEGHTRMLEMVQKHTVPNTGNHSTISVMVDRGHEILQQAKSSSRSFILPPNHRESVPLGSSSLSMYPGYSPAHIEYGEASSAFGDAIGLMKAEGKKWEPPSDGPEYQIGQAHSAKRKMLFRKDPEETAVNDKAEEAAASTDEQSKEEPDAEDRANLYFMIDTNPTPVVVGQKRAAEEIDGGKKKRSKTGKEIVIETEDISAEVEARLKAKEEKKRLKDEKKRRRSSNGEDETVSKKPKKDKSKKREAEEEIEVNGDEEGANKKRKKSKQPE